MFPGAVMPGLPVVLASGSSDVLVQEGGQRFGLPRKPCSAEQLFRILQRVTGIPREADVRPVRGTVSVNGRERNPLSMSGSDARVPAGGHEP